MSESQIQDGSPDKLMLVVTRYVYYALIAHMNTTLPNMSITVANADDNRDMGVLDDATLP